MVDLGTLDYGDRLRLGLIVPSGNAVAEPEIRAMLPPGVQAYVTRLPLTGSSAEELDQMARGLDDAADLLADLDPDLIAFHCTAVTTAGPDVGARISARITHRTGKPAFATSEALLAALRALRVRDVALLTPYLPGPHESERAFLEAHDVRVRRDQALGLNTNREMAALPPAALARFVLEHADAPVEAFVLSCTALRSAGIVASLEDALGRPVLTSNQVTAWYAGALGGLAEPAGTGLLTGAPAVVG